MEPRKLLTAAPQTTVLKAAEMMAKKHVGAVLVVDNEHLVGIFTERDAVFRVMARGLEPKSTALADVMTRDPKTIAPEKPYGTAMLVMHKNGSANAGARQRQAGRHRVFAQRARSRSRGIRFRGAPSQALPGNAVNHRGRGLRVKTSPA
jgi:CBS domain-containing protein